MNPRYIPDVHLFYSDVNLPICNCQTLVIVKPNCENRDVVKSRRNPVWRKRPSINIYKLLSIVLIIVFILFLPTFIKKLIIIKNINCTSQYGQCPNGVINDTSNLTGSDYRFVRSEIEKKLISNYLVESYLVQYQIPSTVKVDIIVKKPDFAVKTGNNYLLVDGDGLILSSASETLLPTVVYEGFNSTLGERVGTSILFSLEVVGKISKLYTLESSELKSDKLLLKLKEGPLVILPVSGEVDKYVGAIRLIYSRLNEGREGFRMVDTKEIDLRFKNPIIRSNI